MTSQGVMFNVLFTSYLLSPKTVHRFVGYLEEEAVKTYTHLLHDIDTPGSEVSKWNTIPAPELAREYWQVSMSHSHTPLRRAATHIRSQAAVPQDVAVGCSLLAQIACASRLIDMARVGTLFGRASWSQTPRCATW
jgi:hypothetical protein